MKIFRLLLACSTTTAGLILLFNKSCSEPQKYRDEHQANDYYVPDSLADYHWLS